MKNNSKTQNQCTVCERNGQLVLALNNEILLPENAPVRLTSAQLEDLDYRGYLLFLKAETLPNLSRLSSLLGMKRGLPQNFIILRQAHLDREREQTNIPIYSR